MDWLFANGNGDRSIVTGFMGYLIASVVVLLTGAVAIKNLLQSGHVASRKDYDELKVQVAGMFAQLTTMSARDYVTRGELAEYRAELALQINKLERYAKARGHRLGEQIGEVKLSVEVLHRDLQQELAAFHRDVGERFDRLREQGEVK